MASTSTMIIPTPEATWRAKPSTAKWTRAVTAKGSAWRVIAPRITGPSREAPLSLAARPAASTPPSACPASR